MKRILSVAGILAFAFLFLSSFALRENPQDPPAGKNTERHIKMVNVDESGKKMELDTIIKGNNVFVWKGDTVGGRKDLKWISKDDFVLDSLHKNMDFNFDYEIKGDGEGKVFIMKSGKRLGSKGDVMMWHSDKGENEMIFGAPRVARVPRPPHAPNVMFMGKPKKGNVIDLSDPGVLSFKKKKMSGGRERITIIRNEVKKEDIEKHEGIIIRGNGDRAMMFRGENPGIEKRIKIMKGENGTFNVTEDNDVFIHSGEKSETVKVIKEDGKVIHIKEINEGGEKKVEVNVEVEEGKKK